MGTTTPADIERDRKYAWDFFQLHGTQRMETFNYYITLATAIMVGITTVLQPTINLPVIALVLSLLLIFLSFIFWKFDQRNKMLIKNAEEALMEIEKHLKDAKGPFTKTDLFLKDFTEVKQRRSHRSWMFWRNHYSYSNCFNLIFALCGLLGGIGIALSVVMLF
jgi:hypothetical protein